MRTIPPPVSMILRICMSLRSAFGSPRTGVGSTCAVGAVVGAAAVGAAAVGGDAAGGALGGVAELPALMNSSENPRTSQILQDERARWVIVACLSIVVRRIP